MPVTQTFRTTASRYELISPIHEGSTATVWRARDTVAALDVVVKQLNPASATDEVARMRLREEAGVSEKVSHPGVVPVIETLFGNDRAAIVFPYVPGRTLSERLRDADPVPQRQAAQIALEVTDVLAAAHAAGVVHRDVKPGNVLLADDGRVRLLDFGIARSETAPLEMTGSGMAIGTLPYMAPEQLTGSSPTPAADVFALGVVLYEMLAGARPFNGASPAEQLELHGRPLPALNAPDPLSALVTATLNPLPAERPSAEQVGRTLRGWLDGRVEAEAATALVVAAVAPPVAASRSGARRLVGIGVAAAVVLLAGAVTLLGFSAAPAAVVPTNEPAQPVAVTPTERPSPTPTRTPTPPPAQPANQPTTSRSGPDNGSAAPKPDKKEGKGKKDGRPNKKGKGKGKGRH